MGSMISQTRVQSIQKLQNKCFQLIFGTNATKEKLHEKNLLLVIDMIKFANGKLMHNHLNGNLPKKIQLAIETGSKDKNLNKNHKYNTRNKNCPNLPMTTNSVYHRSFLFSCIRDFNSLPVVTREINKLQLFTSSCKKASIIHVTSSNYLSFLASCSDKY